jgi:hypothetical protein
MDPSAAYALCTVSAIVGIAVGWTLARAGGEPARLTHSTPSPPAPPVDPPLLSRYEHAAWLLARALPRLSSRLSALPSSHDLEAESRFVDDVRAALDRIESLLRRRVPIAGLPANPPSEPVILLKEDG